MTDHRKIWGERVNTARKAKGLSREALAVSAGLSYETVVSVEQGRRGVSDPTRFALAAALGVDVNELFAYPAEAAA